MASSPRPLPEPQAVRAGGETLRVRRLGAGDRLLLLHGGPGLDHNLLVPLALELADAWEVWLPDLPGHGGSGAHPLSLRQTLERLARWCAACEPRIFGGHSLGAWLARELLRPRAVHPAAAVLLCPPGAARGRLARAARPELGDESEGAQRASLIADLEADGPVDPAVRESVEQTAFRSPSRYGRLQAELLPLLRAAVPPFDPHCPVLVVAGERDRVSPPSAARAVAAATRGAQLRVLPGAGHVLWSVSPGATAEALRDFLAENEL